MDHSILFVVGSVFVSTWSLGHIFPIYECVFSSRFAITTPATLFMLRLGIGLYMAGNGLQMMQNAAVLLQGSHHKLVSLPQFLKDIHLE